MVLASSQVLVTSVEKLRKPKAIKEVLLEMKTEHTLRVLKLLTTSRYEGLATADAFLDAFGLSLLKAYGTLNVTFEADREVAVSEVARFILASHFNEKMDSEELMCRAWVRTTTSSKDQGFAWFGIEGIQPTIPEGKRLLGLGTIKGTPMLADSRTGNPIYYKTASGEVHDTYSIMGSADGLSFSDGVFADVEGQRYHGFVCNAPPLLADEGALLINVFRRVGDPSGLPAIVSVLLGERFEGSPRAAARGRGPGRSARCAPRESRTRTRK